MLKLSNIKIRKLSNKINLYFLNSFIDKIVDNIIYYDGKLRWVDIINNVGMIKSENEIINKRLYDGVFFLKDNLKLPKIKSLYRYMIYSLDEIEIKEKPFQKQNIYTRNLSVILPNKWNWYSNSLTFGPP